MCCGRVAEQYGNILYRRGLKRDALQIKRRRIVKVTATEFESTIISFVKFGNGGVFVYALSGCGFKSHFYHLNFRYRAYFEQRNPRHLGNYRVYIHSKTRT